MELTNVDYAVIAGLIGIHSAIAWRVKFVLTRRIHNSRDEFKAFTSERFARHDQATKEGFDRRDLTTKGGFARLERTMKEGFARQEERLDKHEALLFELVREVSFLRGALMGVPTHPGDRERVGSRD